MLEEFMCDMASKECGKYSPERGSGNEHARQNVWWFFVITALCGIPAIGGQLLIALWPDCPYAGVTWTAETIYKIWIVFACADGYLVIKDWRLNGNLFKAIIAHPIGASIFAAAIVYGCVVIGASAMH